MRTLQAAFVAVSMGTMLPQCGDTQVGNPFKDLEVCPTAGEFQTIQSAITAAESGATIRVCPANYAENLIIDKSITIESTGEPFTLQAPDLDAVVISGAVAVTLRALRIDAPTRVGVMASTARVTLEDVAIDALDGADDDAAAAIRCDACVLDLMRTCISNIDGLGIWANRAEVFAEGLELSDLSNMGLAGIDSALALGDLSIERATIAGIAIFGGSVAATGMTAVQETRATQGGIGGDGIVITDTGAEVPVDFAALTAQDNERLGVLVSGAVDGVVRGGVLAENNRGGFIAQNQTVFVLNAVTIERNTHVGVQALSAELRLENAPVTDTEGGELLGGGGLIETGDGLVGLAGARITVDAVQLDRNARSGILLDGAETRLDSGLEASSSRNNGLGAVFQNGATGPEPALLIVEDNVEPEQRIEVDDERLPMVREALMTVMP
jgi:hypothetical protein